MNSITHNRNGRLFLFGFLYFVQGAMLAYVLVFNNLYLRAFGATAAQLSLLNGLLVVPFILKIGIGLLSDRYGLQRKLPFFHHGHRVPYIALGLLMINMGAFAAGFVPPVTMYPLFLVTALFIAFGLAFYDTTADGLAIDVTPAKEYNLIQGAMVIGRSCGVILLAAIYGRLINLFGWQIIFWIITGLTLLPHLLLWRIREPKQRAPTHAFDWDALRNLWRPQIGRLTLYAIIYSVSVYGANAIVTLFTNEGLGGTLVQVGDVAALGSVGMLLGGITGTTLARRLSIWQQGMITVMIVSVALLLIAFTATLSNIVFIIVLWGFCLASAELVYVTLAMKTTDRRMGAGQFAIFMAISNVGTGIGQATTTGLIDTIEFHWIFASLALLNLLALPLLMAMRANDEPPVTAVSQLPISH
ncbi:MAG: MFS transporter [Chloroflexi bacterium]|nr:MAG: MFS transporter [Chloroflexota bacterium]